MIIGEAEQASGISAKMIRYYETIGLIKAASRTAAGYRVYTQQDIHNLKFIRQCRDLGLSLERIKRLLDLWRDDRRSSADVKKIALDHVAELESKIAAMREMADILQALANRCHGDTEPDCAIIDALAPAAAGCSNSQAKVHKS